MLFRKEQGKVLTLPFVFLGGLVFKHSDLILVES